MTEQTGGLSMDAEEIVERAWFRARYNGQRLTLGVVWRHAMDVYDQERGDAPRDPLVEQRVRMAVLERT